MIITLRNDFHGTLTRIRIDALSQDVGFLRADLTDHQVRLAASRLCKHAGCQCGKIRGAQKHNGKKLVVWRVPTGWSTIAK